VLSLRTTAVLRASAVTLGVSTTTSHHQQQQQQRQRQQLARAALVVTGQCAVLAGTAHSWRLHRPAITPAGSLHCSSTATSSNITRPAAARPA